MQRVSAVKEISPVVLNQVQEDHNYLSQEPQVFYVNPADAVMGGECGIEMIMEVCETVNSESIKHQESPAEETVTIIPADSSNSDANADIAGGNQDSVVGSDGAVLVITPNNSEMVLPNAAVQVRLNSDSVELNSIEGNERTEQTDDTTSESIACGSNVKTEWRAMQATDFELAVSAEGVRTQLDVFEGKSRKPKLRCQICGNIFRSRRQLTCHIKANHPDHAWWHCSECNKDFSSYSAFREHEYKHRGVRSEMCHVCGKAFLSKERLRKHIPTHNDIRPFHCWQCDKTFKQRHSLQKHLVTHTGNFSFSQYAIILKYSDLFITVPVLIHA